MNNGTDTKKQDSDIVESTEELSRRLRKTVRTIHRWKRAGMPVMVDGRYDLVAIAEWRRGRQGMIPPGAGTGEGEASSVAGPKAEVEKHYWDGQNKKMQAQLRELDLRQKKGELIERKHLEDEFVKRIQAVKAGLLALERALPSELIACRTEREMSAAIRKAIRNCLGYFSRPLPPTLLPGEPEDAAT